MLCNEYIGRHFLTLEHKVPLHAGGGTTRENVTATCFGCNKPRYSTFEARVGTEYLVKTPT